MTKHIFWLFEVSIKEGHLDPLKELMQEMSTATQQDEPNMLNYEWWINADESACHIFERYEDSAAVMVHLGNFGSKFAERFMSHADPAAITVYGNAGDDVKAALADFGPQYLTQIGGFTR
jgi:quinol monooxygenase YgiN